MPSGAAVAQVAPEGARKKVFRPDIQGLRMIAVLAVIADHLFHWPTGGFVGVDVFFVISGFLITSLLLREHDKTGTISFAGFYGRRVQRIIPAAAVVLVATLIAAWFLSSAARFQQTLWDAVWSLFFGANWRYAIQGTDYFQGDAAVSPLQHFWSLSVEEQFYFVWPWLMLLIFSLVALSKGTSRHARGIILAAISVISVASFAWAMWETSTAPTWAYFSTFSRAWELGVGALLAVVASLFTKIPTWARTVLAWTGLAGIAVSLVVVNDENGGFPAPWGLLPVIATAIVIISGTGGNARFIWPIANPVSSYLGDISYSLYLWHFPFIILLAPLFPELNWTYYAVVLMFILGASVLSYHLIEDPIRRWSPSGRGRRGHSRTSGHSTPLVPALSVLATALITAGLVTWALIPPAPTDASEYTPPPVSETAAPSDAPTLPPALTARQAAIQGALQAREWPASTDPSLDLSVEETYVTEWTEDGCLNITDRNLDSCVYGDPSADETVALIGDSTAISVMPLLREVYPDKRIQALTMGECPAAEVEVTRLSGAPFPECAEHREWVNEWITANQPSIVVLTDAGTTIERMTAGDAAASTPVYGAGLASELTTIAPFSGRIIVLQSPPQAKSLEACKTPVTGPEDCVAKVTGSYQAWADATASTVAAGGWPNVVNVPVHDWFCSGTSCPAFIGNVRSFAGGSHLTGPAARAAADLFREATGQ